jgi:hypothetical protein
MILLRDFRIGLVISPRVAVLAWGDVYVKSREIPEHRYWPDQSQTIPTLTVSYYWTCKNQHIATKYVINSLIHGHFHIGLVIIPRPILAIDSVSGQYGIRICTKISVFAPVFNFQYLRRGLKDYMSKYKERWCITICIKSYFNQKINP